MKAIKKILYPTDFSDNSRPAFMYALLLAEKFGAKLFIQHVFSEERTLDPIFVAGGFKIDKMWSYMQENFIPMVKKFVGNEAKDVEYEAVLSNGKPCDEIIRFAERENIDMIVMGTHGETGLEHFMIGSVAERVLRKSHIPVLAVKGK